MHGVFPPNEVGYGEALKYTEKLKIKHPDIQFSINKVFNLNKFLSSR